MHVSLGISLGSKVNLGNKSFYNRLLFRIPNPTSQNTATATATMLVPLLRSSILLFLLLFLLPAKTYSQDDLVLTYCSGNTNFTTPSPYKTNLDVVLANLTASNSSYYSTATAASTSASAAAYGLMQCRPDVSLSDCSDCVNRAAAAALLRCTNRTSAAIRYDNCLLRYSDQRFFSHVEDGRLSILMNKLNATDLTVFDSRLTDLMVNVTSNAAAANSRFAVGITNYSKLQDLYAMAECTQDLKADDCSACLETVFSYLRSYCYGKIGGQVHSVSCFVRFETYSFFSRSAVPPPPATAVPPPPATAVSEHPTSSGGKDKGKTSNTRKIFIIVIPVVVALVLLLAICIYFLKRKKTFKRAPYIPDEHELRSSDSLLFELDTLRAATNNFSDANKLGEGGFGPVYKGTLQDGQEIAVKRLSMASLQGLVELRNEVVLVAKLQHRNLVKLFGFCLEEQEKLLVYEYLSNKSLDKFLSDHSGRQQLHWGRRYKIIEGICRGILYLHEDSRLKIIHRDLKASNILLDGDMNPKISDFGLARLFGADETQGNTSKIAGTRGYMSPEYAMHGHFSTKSDVFSFGVLVLEIVTGQKNSDFQGSDQIDLLSHVWQHWTEGKALEVKDPSMGDRCRVQELLRCIHIGLLCVQENPSERPNMASVHLMLSSSSVTLPAPSAPTFYIRGSPRSESYMFDQSANFSANDVTISEWEPR